ncbi:MAG: YtxH domain-containing protein [Bacteroidota bacterium]|nr:YtxH domain-containing protein [Bacteroidota bacterium]
MKTFWTFFTGVAAGTVFAILYAPDRGTETRRKIADRTRRLTDEITGNAESTMHEMTEKGEKAYRKANEMVGRNR